MELISGSGNKIWVQISETLVKQNGQTVIDGLIDDITKQKQAADRIQELNRTLEQRVRERTQSLKNINEELETFAFSVSHDLRSPIRQIDGFVSYLSRFMSEDRNQKE